MREPEEVCSFGRRNHGRHAKVLREVGTAGDGREAQRQEVGSNFRNTTRNTIDILSAIKFETRLQAAATSGKEAMPNEQSKMDPLKGFIFHPL